MLSDPNLIAEFVVESLEHLEAVEPLLLELEKRGATDAASLNEIFRAVHSIKGAAGFLGLENVSALSHAMESLLMRVRDGECPLRADMADPLLRAVDALRTLLRGLPDSQGEPPTAIVARLEKLLAAGAPAPASGDAFEAACDAQRRKGHNVARVALPSKKRDREKLEKRLALFGEVLPEPGGKKASAVVGSPLEPDLLAEALELDASRIELVTAPVVGAIDEFPLPDPSRPLSRYFGQVAVDMGLLSDEARRQVLQTQRSSLLRRTFRETALALRLLSAADADRVFAEQDAPARRTRARP